MIYLHTVVGVSLLSYGINIYIYYPLLAGFHWHIPSLADPPLPRSSLTLLAGIVVSSDVVSSLPREACGPSLPVNSGVLGVRSGLG